MHIEKIDLMTNNLKKRKMNINNRNNMEKVRKKSLSEISKGKKNFYLCVKDG